MADLDLLRAVEMHLAGRLTDAERVYRVVLKHQPDQVDALHLLGTVLSQSGKPAEGELFLRRAIEITPNVSAFHDNLGNALQAQGKYDKAVAAHRRAIELDPNSVPSNSNLGAALQRGGRAEEAIEFCRRAIQLKPDYAPAYFNLGSALQKLGRLEESIPILRRAIQLRPNEAESHLVLAQTLLACGEYEEGFREYEWRWKYSRFRSPPRNFSQPLWNGQPHPGKTLLIHGEQGFGDILQFIRLLPLARERFTGKIIFETLPALSRLLAKTPGADTVIVFGSPSPKFDVHCPLLSLARALNLTLQNVPADVPYIRTDASLVEQWAGRIPKSDRRKIGFAWAGNRAHENDRNRSLPSAMLAALCDVSNVDFASLQIGADLNEVAAQGGPRLIDVTDGIKDFADTGAVISNLDLVITVDTAVAHLAGAMGKPVWILLPEGADWRWLRHRDDSLWYPSARLFRQMVRGDWSGVMNRVLLALREDK